MLKHIATLAVALAFTFAFTACEGLEETVASGNSQVQEIEEKTGQELTESQKQAITSATQYLELSGFSRQGLIRQLSSKAGEGFPKKDARFAVDNLDVNWKKEAVEAAKEYLATSSFSRQGLIRQLESKAGSGFTHAQAVHAVDKVGL